MSRGDQAGDIGLERAVGRVLRLGLGATTVCLTLGVLAALFGPAGRLSATLLASGVVILLATPAARVAVSVADYARERDWLFFALTLVVLLELLASVIAAMHAG